MKRHIILAGALALAPVLLGGDLPQLSSPVLGYVFEEGSQTTRTVSGVPGSAHLAAAIAIPETLHNVTVNSAGRVAIGLGKDERLVAASWTETDARLVTLESSLGKLEQVSFSHSGKFAAIRDAATVELWSNLREQPALVRRFGAAGLLAVNDAGEVAVASSDGITVHGETDRWLAPGGSWSAIQFASEGDLLASDASRLELVRITPAGALTTIVPLGAPVTAIAENEGSIAFLAGKIVVVLPSSGDPSILECDCEAKGLDLLEGDLVASLRGTSVVLDANNSPARLTTLFHVPNAGGSAQ
jgi:hypothetical protein